MSAPASVPDGFARPLPSPHPRDHLLFDYFRRLASAQTTAASPAFARLAVRRSAVKGRYLCTADEPARGALLFEEKHVLSVSDDESVCLACGIRHAEASAAAASAASAAAASSSKCARFSSLFGAMKTALSSAAPLSSQADYPLARVRELLKFVGVTHAAIFAPERTPLGQTKRSEQQRKADCPAWLLLGLDDGSYTVESTDAATGQTVYTTTPRASDPDRTMVAQQVHALLPLTFRKHYPPALLEQVLNVLELNAHETSEAGPTAASSAEPDAPLSVEGMSGDAVFPFFAMCEHSCLENCCWSASDNRMRITALRDFARGISPEQLARRYAAEAAAATTAVNGKSASSPPAAAVASQCRPRGSMCFAFHTALVRGLSSAFEHSLKMHPPPVPIDVALAKAQHEAYCDVLRKCVTGGVIEVPESAEFPDCNFIEDTAIVMGDVVVISRPGALERRGETVAVAAALESHKLGFRRMLHMAEPATMDGGDVMFTGRHLFVGESKRTNAAATAQLQSMFAADPLVRFTVHALPVTAGLHLKSIVSILADGVLVLASNPAAELVRQEIVRIDPSYEFIVVPHAEASNVLRIGRTLLLQKGFDASTAILRPHAQKHGLEIVELEMSELIKADGALTCGSLLVTDLSQQQDADPELIPLSINYAPVFLPTSKRRAYLQANYGFRCVCPLCEGQSSGVHDLARAFRCTQQQTPAIAAASSSSSKAAAAASTPSSCVGTMCPLGESTPDSLGRWSCTACGSVPSDDTIRGFLAAESYILQDLLRIKESVLTLPSTAPLAEGEDVFDEMASDPALVAQRMLPKLEQIVAATAATAGTTGASSGGTAVAAATGSTASASSSSASSLASSFSSLRCTPSASKTSRKLARLRKIGSKRSAASGAGTPAGFCLLDANQRAMVAKLHASHWMVNASAELILGAKLSQLLALPEAEAAPQWAALLPLAHLRIASLRTVLRSTTHWSLAREFDRLGALCTLGGRSAEANAAWVAAEQVHQACFGSEADSTRRARARRERPPRNRQELGLDEPEDEDEDE